MRIGAHPTSERGYSLPEVMVAMLVLLVGLLSVVTIVQTADRTQATSNQRIGATNLARELLEQTRTLPYATMTGGSIESALKARGYGSGTPWTIVRRNVTYTATVTSCMYDDPVDGIATSGDRCTPLGSSAKQDADGNDFRRVTFRLAWTSGGQTRQIVQDELIVNPSGGLGPRVVVTGPTSVLSGQTASFSATTNETAETLRWTIDDGESKGAINGPATNFSWTWDLKHVSTPNAVLDGTYQLVAQAFNDRNIPGEARIHVIVVNRQLPFAPTGFAGGHVTRLADQIDFDWVLNKERDIVGYRVYWAGPDEVVRNADDQLVCPATPGGFLDRNVASCADTTHPGLDGVWYVVALDRVGTSNTVREGAPTTLDVDKPGNRPNPPKGPVTRAIVDGSLVLDWDPPTSGSTPSFYRIYRDGIQYAKRYGTSVQTTFTDSDTETGAHDYWVVAVDSEYNESDPVPAQ